MKGTQVYLESDLEVIRKIAEALGLGISYEKVSDVISYTNVQIDIPEEHEKEMSILLACAIGLKNKL